MKYTLNIFSNIVHNLQNERGITALSLGDNSVRSSKDIQKKFSDTDKSISVLKTKIHIWKDEQLLNEELLIQISELLGALEKRHILRTKILSLKASYEEAIKYYSHCLILPLIQLITKISLLIENHHPSAVSAYNCFLQWKERVGLERAIAMKGFVFHDFSSDDFLDRVLFLINEQNSFKESFLSLATLEQKKLVDSIYLYPEVQKLRTIHHDFEVSYDSVLLKNLSPKEWFNIVSAKIDALYEIEKKLISTLDEVHQLSSTPNKKQHHNYSYLIQDLPIFNGLSLEDIYQINKYGKIYHAPKNKIIFIENSAPTHLHIVFSGWVKVYKNLADGKEAILYILGKGECISGHSIFLDSTFGTTAQTITDTILFSLPIFFVKKYITNNPNIALNFLTAISQHVITLEQKLKFDPADKKVKYFLISLLQKQECKVTQITLPYNKSTIASYLGISRETLSRTFGRLKKEGIVVLKNKVQLSHSKILCNNCEIHLYQKCPWNKNKSPEFNISNSDINTNL